MPTSRTHTVDSKKKVQPQKPTSKKSNLIRQKKDSLLVIKTFSKPTIQTPTKKGIQIGIFILDSNEY